MQIRWRGGEALELLYAAVRMSDGTAVSEDTAAVSQKMKHRITTQPAISLKYNFTEYIVYCWNRDCPSQVHVLSPWFPVGDNCVVRW